MVKRAEATAEVFMTAFESLPKSDRDVILQRLFADPALREDLIDVAAWHERRNERAVPYQRVRGRLKKAGRL
jgi:CRP-like cAMP-binding protein